MNKKVVPFAKNECCGCTVCYDVCPVSAISLKIDNEGFVYPDVDDNKCIKCGLCSKVCAFGNRKLEEKSDKLPTTVVAKHVDKDTRMKGSSGSIFIAVSDYILDNGGSVYGCVLNDEFKAVHMRATTKETRDLMCRSKYVQSDIKGIFPQIENDLAEKRMVLFSGTACQVDSLHSYLKYKKSDVSKLYTIDLICHGVPSPKMYEDYFKWSEKKHNGKITDFSFRDKEARGWNSHFESFVINNKKYVKGIYRELFYTNCPLRPSCYNCKYVSVNRYSEITIGDAWGIKKNLPHLYDDTGVSTVIINNDKGKELFEKIKSCFEYENVSLELLLQPNLQHASQPKKDREQFWKTYEQGGIDLLIKKYAPYSIVNRLFRKIKFIIKKKIKK